MAPSTVIRVPRFAHAAVEIERYEAQKARLENLQQALAVFEANRQMMKRRGLLMADIVGGKTAAAVLRDIADDLETLPAPGTTP